MSAHDMNESRFHVVNGTVGYSSDLSNTTLTALSGGDITITVGEEGDVFVGFCDFAEVVEGFFCEGAAAVPEEG